MSQASLLDLIAEDRIHATDRATVEAAIRADAETHDGHVDPNRVRAALTNAHGLTVYPRVIGAVYSGLRRAGVLVADGWTVNTDERGRNAGKPARTYRLIGGRRDDHQDSTRTSHGHLAQRPADRAH